MNYPVSLDLIVYILLVEVCIIFGFCIFALIYELYKNFKD